LPRNAPRIVEELVRAGYQPLHRADLNGLLERALGQGGRGWSEPTTAPAGTRYPGGNGGPRSARATDAAAASERRDREVPLPLPIRQAYRGGCFAVDVPTAHRQPGRTYRVNVPAGIRHGQRLRLAGQGRRGTPPGDLYLIVELSPEPDLRFEADDLVLAVRLGASAARSGGRLRLPGLDGVVRVDLPGGLSSGMRVKLAGQGYGAARGSRGDLYLELSVEADTDEG
jgi:curved DNA-binding protein